MRLVLFTYSKVSVQFILLNKYRNIFTILIKQKITFLISDFSSKFKLEEKWNVANVKNLLRVQSFISPKIIKIYYVYEIKHRSIQIFLNKIK